MQGNGGKEAPASLFPLRKKIDCSAWLELDTHWAMICYEGELLSSNSRNKQKTFPLCLFLWGGALLCILIPSELWNCPYCWPGSWFRFALWTYHSVSHLTQCTVPQSLLFVVTLHQLLIKLVFWHHLPLIFAAFLRARNLEQNLGWLSAL